MVTKAESKWMEKISAFGCIVCYRLGVRNRRTAAVHHILNGNKHKGHLFTIPLCDPGHHKNPLSGHVSRHPNKLRFERVYGSEMGMLEEIKRLIND